MLDRHALTDALGREVSRVRRTPLPQPHSSTEAVFERVSVDGAEATRLIVKVIDRSRDWVAIATGDTVDREVAFWESGTLDRLPHHAGHAIVSAARYPGGSAILMRDLAAGFIEDDDPRFLAYNAATLRSLAAVHGAFWQAPSLKALRSTACTLAAFTSHLAPTHLPTLRAAIPGHFIIDVIDEGWQTLPDLIGPGLAAEMRALATDPSPIVRALSVFPSTLLHTDVRPEDVAYVGRQIVFIDWARPCVGPPGIDLAYFLLMSHGPIRDSADDIVAEYRRHLDAMLSTGATAGWWDEQLDVCIASVFATAAAAQASRAASIRSRRGGRGMRHPPLVADAIAKGRAPDTVATMRSETSTRPNRSCRPESVPAALIVQQRHRHA